MSKIAENIETVRQRISAAAQRSGRDPSAIKLLAVTKTAAVEQVKEALSAGILDLAENKVQEALKKNSCLSGFSGIKWHMIGHLQTNKAKQAVGLFTEIHSVDSLRLAAEIGKRALEHDRIIPVFVEINVSGEVSKYGASPAELDELMDGILPLRGIMVKGLMTMAPYSDDPEASRPYFRQLKGLADRFGLKELSMGMSGDFEVAVEEGATVLRVGSAIFNE